MTGGLAQLIDEGVKQVEKYGKQLSFHNSDRGGFTQETVERFYNDPSKPANYNVLMVLSTASFTEQFIDKVQDVRVDWPRGGGSYRVFVFKEGKFMLHSDGGYGNWCFKGNFERHGSQGGTVIFSH